MMRQIGLTAGAVALVLTGSVQADRGRSSVSARLQPRNEVPAVISPARGTFSARFDEVAQTVEYTLSYSGLMTEVRQAHIHIAQPNVNGGIMVWFCGSATNPGPAGTQVCPQGAGTVTGVITPADVQAVTSQGIESGSFDDFAAAVRAGLAYVNVHTAQSPGGEIRGQVRVTPDRD